MFSAFVHAGEVNLTALPTVVNETLLLNNLWLAELLCTLVMFTMITISVAFLTYNIMLILLSGGFVLITATALGWLDAWIIIFLCMIVAGMFSTSLYQELFGGG